MFAALIILSAAALLIRWQPGLPLSRFLDEWLARRPAAWLLRRSRREVLAWSIAAALLVFGGEYVLVLGGPHVVLAFTVDLAAYVDALIAVATLVSVARIRAGARWLGLRGARGAKPRTRRSPRHASVRQPSNDDDEDRPRIALAA